MDLKPEGNPLEAEAALQAEIDAIAERGLDARELEKAKNNLTATLMRELVTNSGRAHGLGTYEMMLGDWRKGLALPSAYEAITSEDVKRAVRTYLSKERRNVVTLVPQRENEAASA
jgi:predicted Zn-dependent peptidase